MVYAFDITAVSDFKMFGYRNILLLLLLIIILGNNSDGFVYENYKNNCVCVPGNMCQDNDTLINKDGLLEIRSIKGFCENYYEVCCENPIKDIKLETESSNIQSKLFRGCGYGNSPSFGYRITGDSINAHFAELPWTIVILYKDPQTDRNIYKCGGSLIHQQVVLTAAHCINERTPNRWIVRAGEWDTKNQNEPLPHQDRLVKEFIIHPYYHSGSLKNDIVLLVLKQPLKLADNVGIICLLESETTLDNTRCIASGWGKSASRKGKHSPILKKVELPIVERDACQKSLRETRLGKYYHLHPSFICAGGELNRDTCKGDGGSPLVCPIPGYKGRYFQAGIVSWGIGCGEHKTPGVYVNVGLYSQWIDNHITARNLDVSIYKYNEMYKIYS